MQVQTILKTAEGALARRVRANDEEDWAYQVWDASEENWEDCLEAEMWALLCQHLNEVGL